MAAALAALTFHDTRRPIDEVVYSTDLSTGESGRSISRYGVKCGVASRHFETEVVWDFAEAKSGDTLWSVRLDLVISHLARRQSSRPSVPVESVVAVNWGPLETWQNVTLGCWGTRRQSPSGRTGLDAWRLPQLSHAARPWKFAPHFA